MEHIYFKYLRRLLQRMFGEGSPGCCGLLSLSVGESLRYFVLNSLFDFIWIVQGRKGEDKTFWGEDLHKVQNWQIFIIH